MPWARLLLLIGVAAAAYRAGVADSTSSSREPVASSTAGARAPTLDRGPDLARRPPDVRPPPADTVAGTKRPKAPIARHVIIISEDGLRPDALEKANGRTMAAVMRRGAYSLRARTIRKASTLQAHAAMLSGFDVPLHKLTWNSWHPERGNIQVPTIFEAAERGGGGAAAFVAKQKLQHIAYPGSVDVFELPGAFCRKVVEAAARYFVERRPQVEFIHFADPDEIGHKSGWMSDVQIRAIRQTDHCLATLLDEVDRAGLAGDTLFILSADHGGRGFNHTGHHEEDRLIPWIAWGAGVRAGHVVTSPISTMDTAATALWALGYPQPPHIQGRPVLEAFNQ